MSRLRSQRGLWERREGSFNLDTLCFYWIPAKNMPEWQGREGNDRAEKGNGRAEGENDRAGVCLKNGIPAKSPDKPTAAGGMLATASLWHRTHLRE